MECGQALGNRLFLRGSLDLRFSPAGTDGSCSVQNQRFPFAQVDQRLVVLALSPHIVVRAEPPQDVARANASRQHHRHIPLTEQNH
jgi:hypothetical protein